MTLLTLILCKIGVESIVYKLKEVLFRVNKQKIIHDRIYDFVSFKITDKIKKALKGEEV